MSTSELPSINVPVWSTESPEFPPTFERPNGELPLWTDEAPDKLVGYSQTGDHDRAWRAWRKHLGRRKSPLAKSALEKYGITEALQWGFSLREADAELLVSLALPGGTNGAPNLLHKRALEILLTDVGDRLDERAALLHLGGALALPELAATVPERTWWTLLGRLHQTALDAAALVVSDQPLLHQWLAGELALVLAVLFPELAPCTELLPRARRALSVGFEELLDGKGVPHWRYLSRQQPLVACWTRAAILSEPLDAPAWDDAAQTQYPFAVREMLRTARRDGGSLFDDHPTGRVVSAATVRFFTTAVTHSNDRKNEAVLRRSGWTGMREKKDAVAQRPPRPANHSEWSQAAVLRPDWRRASPHLGISYGDRTICGELQLGRQRLFTGDWRFSCRVDDKEATADGDWEEVCWVSDDDVDYLELEIHLTEGLRLQRQICLAREDRFLFVADALLGGRQRKLDHTLRIPLGPGVAATANEESREVMLGEAKRRALLFPLALPEWRIDPRGGELAADNAIELRQAGRGEGLYAPLWIDLDPSRHEKPFTWRQLTVADERQVVPREVAAGYRVQFGKKQWLIYRSLSPARNRTLLGHNLSTEFLIARFSRDGSVTPLIEVE